MTEEIKILSKFSNKIFPVFKEQIERDLSYFNQEYSLLERALEAIRAVVEIDQAERDRRLERTVQVIGTGLAVGALVASSSPNSLIEKPIQLPFIEEPIQLSFSSYTPHPFFFSFLVSFSAVIVFGFLAWLITGKSDRLLP
ncbi:MAG: hypothetical protein AB4038_06330 [Prochloraceae cyanobacterium]